MIRDLLNVWRENPVSALTGAVITLALIFGAPTYCWLIQNGDRLIGGML
ncbi:hypothetical protein [Paracoccus suum]|nr:hypothetical protein [Paracoccus suum]